MSKHSPSRLALCAVAVVAVVAVGCGSSTSRAARVRRTTSIAQTRAAFGAPVLASGGRGRLAWATTQDGLSVSSDVGATWKRVLTTQFALDTPVAVAAQGASSIIVVAGVDPTRLTEWRSTDAGATWRRLTIDALPASHVNPALVPVTSLSMSFADTAAGLLAVDYGYDHTNPQGATLDTADGGSTWRVTPLTTALTALDMRSPHTALAVEGPGQELVGTLDGADDWQPIPLVARTSRSWVDLIAFTDPESAAVLAAVTDGRGERTVLDTAARVTGNRWSLTDVAGIDGVRAQVVAPTQRGTLLMAPRADGAPDAFVVSSGGSTSPVATRGLPVAPAYLTRLSDGVLLASTDTQLCVHRANCRTVSGLWRSVDGGVNWSSLAATGT
jgi:photosystem II stability/assembly factor-like uncharacterized protein